MVGRPPAAAGSMLSARGPASLLSSQEECAASVLLDSMHWQVLNLLMGEL